MTHHRITGPGDPLLAPLWHIYQHSFPEVEQRTFEDHCRALADPAFHCDALTAPGEQSARTCCGLMCFWDLGGLRYIEHFAMHPDHRCGGHGSRILREFAARTRDRLLMLEIDPLESDIARRRLGFYQRLGFVLNKDVYVHPPYQEGHPHYDLLLLSLGRSMTPEERALFEASIEREVMRYAAGR